MPKFWRSNMAQAVALLLALLVSAPSALAQAGQTDQEMQEQEDEWISIVLPPSFDRKRLMESGGFRSMSSKDDGLYGEMSTAYLSSGLRGVLAVLRVLDGLTTVVKGYQLYQIEIGVVVTADGEIRVVLPASAALGGRVTTSMKLVFRRSSP